MNMLEWIREQLAAIDPESVEGPSDEVSEGEEVVGVLDDPELRCLFALRSRTINEHNDAMKAAEAHIHEKLEGSLRELFESFGKEKPVENEPVAGEEAHDHDPLTCEVCMAGRQGKALSDKCDALAALFWGSVRASIPESAAPKLYKSDGLGVRKDWQIVALPKKEQSESARILGIGLGGMPFPLGGLADVLAGIRSGSCGD